MQRILRTVPFIIFQAIALLSSAQINTDQVMRIGANNLYFEDYVLSIQYFNQVIDVKPYLAKPYFLRSIAKLNLDDYLGAEKDATLYHCCPTTVGFSITKQWHNRTSRILMGQPRLI